MPHYNVDIKKHFVHELYNIYHHVGEKIFLKYFVTHKKIVGITFWVFCIVRLWIYFSQLVPVMWLGHQVP